MVTNRKYNFIAFLLLVLFSGQLLAVPFQICNSTPSDHSQHLMHDDEHSTPSEANPHHQMSCCDSADQCTMNLCMSSAAIIEWLTLPELAPNSDKVNLTLTSFYTLAPPSLDKPPITS